MFRRSLVIAGLAALAVGVVSDSALAQFYRGKTITMIINYPAGGPTDIEGRIVAQHLPAHIAGKPTIVIKNVGGAGGVIGTNQLAEAAPNGETIGFFTIDVVAQLLLQFREIGTAGPQHLAHFGSVEDREQQMLDRQVLVACLARLVERVVETVFELVG